MKNFKISITFSYHISVADFNNYIQQYDTRLQDSFQEIKLGDEIKTLSIFFTCFLGSSHKIKTIFYKGKRKIKLRTLGFSEFEDYMEIFLPLEIEKVISLIKENDKKEISQYISIKVIESIHVLKIKYHKETKNFDWNALLNSISLINF